MPQGTYVRDWCHGWNWTAYWTSLSYTDIWVKITQRYCMSFVWSLMDPENYCGWGSGCHTSVSQDLSRNAPEQYQCTPRNCLIAINLNFFFRMLFTWLCFYQLKFRYATWIFCQIIRDGKGVLYSKAFVHIILTSYSSARDKNAYQEPTQISRAGREREIASHFGFTSFSVNPGEVRGVRLVYTF